MKVMLAADAALWLFCVSTMAAPSDTTAQFDQETGLFVIKHNTLEVAKPSFVFWSGNWEWRGLTTATDILASFAYRFSGINKETKLSVKTSVRRSADNRMDWRMRVEPGTAIYGGLAIPFSLESLAEEAFAPVPELLPGGGGWLLKFAAGKEPVKFMVSPTPSTVIFEPGQKVEVRVYFVKPTEELATGDYITTPELLAGGVIEPTTAERLFQPDQSWYNDLVDIGISPVDLSFLNAAERPAGQHRQLGVANDQLVFADGTPARFWGANLTAYALFQTGLNDTIKHAKRLSKLGFNLVRIHHFDLDWVGPNILGGETGEELELDVESLRRLDWWIKALGDKAIYVWLDLNVERVFTAEGLAGANEMKAGQKGPTAAGYALINTGIEARMQELNRLLLNHVNQYTNFAYWEDPRIAFLMLTNENDLTYHFGNMFLPDKSRLGDNDIYMAEAACFADEKKLDAEATWKSWLFGPSKLFLSEFEHGFNERMIAYLESIGSKAVISTPNTFGGNSVAGLLSLADGGVVAVNIYANSSVLEADPRYAPNLLGWIAAAGMTGKPLAITEWNMGNYPSHERATLPAYVAAIASFQDWTAPMEYAYSQSSLDQPGRVTQWKMANDPALLAMMPFGALIFRQQHVKPGESVHYLRPSTAEFIDTAPLSRHFPRYPYITETARWRLALPALKEREWFKPSPPDQDGNTVSDMAADFSGPGGQVCAETGDFCRDRRRGIFTVDTTMTQLASGWIGGETIALTKSTTIALKTAYGTLAVQSLDLKPITESRSILVSLAAQTLPAKVDNSSIRSEPIVGQVSFTARPGLRAYATLGDGRQKQIPARYEYNAYHLDLNAGLGTYWIVFRDAQ